MDEQFRFSSNSFHLALTSHCAGIAVALSSLWALALLVVMVVLMDRGVIAIISGHRKATAVDNPLKLRYNTD